MNDEQKNEYKRKIAACLASGSCKADCIRQVAVNFPELVRQDAIELYSMEGLDMSSVQASTYFYTYHAPQLKSLDVEVAETPQALLEIKTETLSDSLRIASEQAANWYLERTHETTRENFLKRGGINDNARGAVYSYHNSLETNYVGITGNRVKSRLTTPTSPHAKKPWWDNWTYMRFLPLEAKVDRQILEYLLILSLKPTINQNPQSIDFKTFLSQYQ